MTGTEALSLTLLRARILATESTPLFTIKLLTDPVRRDHHLALAVLEGGSGAGPGRAGITLAQYIQSIAVLYVCSSRNTLRLYN